jgi:hypothetical protein
LLAVQVEPLQQVSPAPPQPPQEPSVQVPLRLPHAPPGATQRPKTQQPPPAHSLPAQQALPAVPQAAGASIVTGGPSFIIGASPPLPPGLPPEPPEPPGFPPSDPPLPASVGVPLPLHDAASTRASPHRATNPGRPSIATIEGSPFTLLFRHPHRRVSADA